MQKIDLNDIRILLNAYIKKSSIIGNFFDTYESTGQVLSTTSTLAPLIVNSNTVVTNLNADTLDGYHASDIISIGGDHGTLAGLGDDDHVIYPLCDGSRGFSAPVGGSSPIISQHLATKQYVDDAIVISGAVPADHGLLLGLIDDDHPQYTLASGARAFLGAVAGIDPTLSNQLATKNYVDTIVATSGAMLSDHGGLSGLTDDDHPQYTLTNGMRVVTGTQIFEDCVIVSGSVTGIYTNIIDTTSNVNFGGGPRINPIGIWFGAGSYPGTGGDNTPLKIIGSGIFDDDLRIHGNSYVENNQTINGDISVMGTVTGATTFDTMPIFDYSATSGYVVSSNDSLGTTMWTQQTLDISISAASMMGTDTDGAGDASNLPERIEIAPSGMNIDFMAFDGGTNENAFFTLSLPYGWDEGAVTFRTKWSVAAGSAGDTVIWQLKGVALEDGDDLTTPPFCTPTEITDSVINTDRMHISPKSGDMILGGNPVRGDSCHFILTRDAANDTHATDARLHELILTFNRRSPTDGV